MYAKIFASLYQGTLRGCSDEILVFTNMLAHADLTGIVDKHWRAIAEETGLTRERVEAAIKNLEAPDPESRSQEMDGRRIALMDEHRAWGWQIVNHGKYRAIKNEEDRREQNRLAQERFRNKQNSKQSKPSVMEGKQDKPIQIQIHNTDTVKTLVAKATANRFDEFWKAWPATDRKTAKAACEKKWRLQNLDSIADQILSYIESLKQTRKWEEGFEPAPMTFINQKHWLDGEVVIATPVDRWWSSDKGIDRKAKELGIRPTGSDSYATLKEKISLKLKNEERVDHGG